MQSGARERGILDGLSARDKSDNEAQQPAKWKSERVMIGKRSYPYSGAVQSKILVPFWPPHYSPLRVSFGASASMRFYWWGHQEYPFRLGGGHGAVPGK